MIDKKETEKIFSLLESVKDPEIGISITRLRMIDSVDYSDGTLKLKVKLTVPGCPLSSTIEKDAKEVLEKAGYKRVEVEFGYMTKQELDSVKKELVRENKSTPASIERYEKKLIKNIVAVYSAKGGVGKSTVVAFLALISKQLGYKTGILDCDISGPSIKTLLNIKDRALMDSDGRIKPYDYDGIKLVSVDMLTDVGALIWRGPLVSGAIKQMYGDTDWGNLDVLFLDMPPGTSDAPLTVFQSIPVDRILLITTPQLLSQTVGKKTMFMVDTLRIPVYGIIENMAYIQCPHCGNKQDLSSGREERIRKTPVLAQLPFNPAISYTDVKSTLGAEALSGLADVVKAVVQ
jgi:ATP-binding protein involved in chromosome partitioning